MDPLQDLGALIDTAGSDDDSCPLFGEFQCSGLAKAGASTGHQRYFAFEHLHASLL
jgi:hypothetical protein